MRYCFSKILILRHLKTTKKNKNFNWFLDLNIFWSGPILITENRPPPTYTEYKHRTYVLNILGKYTWNSNSKRNNSKFHKYCRPHHHSSSTLSSIHCINCETFRKPGKRLGGNVEVMWFEKIVKFSTIFLPKLVHMLYGMSRVCAQFGNGW